MMRNVALILVLLWCSRTAAQHPIDTLVIVKVSYQNGYIYIPPSALKDSVEAVLIDGDLEKSRGVKPTFSLWWSTLCNDGYFHITITPKQIYFHSSHDNPNPNFLFWVMNIDSVQYRAIASALKRKTPVGFKRYNPDVYHFHDERFKDKVSIPDNWTDRNVAAFDKTCDGQREQQLHRYFLLLNTFIPDARHELVLPPLSERKKIRAKYFGPNLEELKDWMPHKFTPPVKTNQ